MTETDARSDFLARAARGGVVPLVREVADGIVGLPRGAPAVGLRPALHGAAAVAPRFARLGPEERVAGPALAADQRLEQEAERRPGDLREHRHRRVGIEHHLAHQRHDAAARRARQEIAASVTHRGAAIRYRPGDSSALATVSAPACPLLRPGTQWSGESSRHSPRACSYAAALV